SWRVMVMGFVLLSSGRDGSMVGVLASRGPGAVAFFSGVVKAVGGTIGSRTAEFLPVFSEASGAGRGVLSKFALRVNSWIILAEWKKRTFGSLELGDIIPNVTFWDPFPSMP